MIPKMPGSLPDFRNIIIQVPEDFAATLRAAAAASSLSISGEVIRRVEASYMLDYSTDGGDSARSLSTATINADVLARLSELEGLLRNIRTEIDDTIGFEPYLPPLEEEKSWPTRALRTIRQQINTAVSPGPDFSDDIQNS